MSLYSVLGIIMLAVGLFIILLIVTQLYKALPNVIRGAIVAIKQMFCCNVLGCTGDIFAEISKLNIGICLTICSSCTCDYCE
jgi:hypothetical protein